MHLRIPDGVKIIYESTFWRCGNVTKVVLGDNVQKLLFSAFGKCKNMESIVIPNSLTYIDESVFAQCEGLTSVYYKGTEEQWGKIAILDGFGENRTLKEASRYYYSEEEPPLNEDGTAYDGNYWYYDSNGEIVVWVMD